MPGANAISGIVKQSGSALKQSLMCINGSTWCGASPWLSSYRTLAAGMSTAVVARARRT
jgi:hypothetical protein